MIAFGGCSAGLCLVVCSAGGGGELSAVRSLLLARGPCVFRPAVFERFQSPSVTCVPRRGDGKPSIGGIPGRPEFGGGVVDVKALLALR